MTKVQKLLSISSPPLAAQPLDEPKTLGVYPLGTELFGVLKERNGFYAFESALHVFPHTTDTASGMSFEEWNSDSLWRNSYEDLAKGLVFLRKMSFRTSFAFRPREWCDS